MQRSISLFVVIQAMALFASAQTTDSNTRGPDQPPAAHDQMTMAGTSMTMPHPDWMPSSHVSSGTGWQPAAIVEHAWMKSHAGWDMMAHGVIFVDRSVFTFRRHSRWRSARRS